MSEILPYSSGQAVVSPRGAVGVAIDIVAPVIASYAGLEDPMTAENKSFLMDYGSAVRSAVMQHRRDGLGERPSLAEREISRMGDVIVMTSTLAGLEYFRNREEIIDLTSAVVESAYDPRAVVRVVRNPRQSLDIDNVSPTRLAHLLNVWGEIASNMTSNGRDTSSAKAMERDVLSQTPSLRQIHGALGHLGVGLESRIPVEEGDIFYVAGMLRRQETTVTPRLTSNPYGDLPTETYEVAVARFGRIDDKPMSFEDGFRFTAPWEPDGLMSPEDEQDLHTRITDAYEYAREHPTE